MELPGLSFAVGLRFQDELRATLGLPVSFSFADSFHLVVAFGRCKFKLSPQSVGLILQATIGGFASFKVSLLNDRVFKLSVTSKEVGLIVHRLTSFECPLFKLYFHLWGGGGPDWRAEHKLFLEEERNSWSHAPSSRPRALSFADTVRKPMANPPLSGANATPLGGPSPMAPTRTSVFRRIEFPRKSVFERIEPGPCLPQPRRGGDAMNLPCPRCLLPGHARRDCHWPIRCRASLIVAN